MKKDKNPNKNPPTMMMQVRTEKLGELPLVDFYPVDYGQQQQAFGFEVRIHKALSH